MRNLSAVGAGYSTAIPSTQPRREIRRHSGESRLNSQINEFHQFRERKSTPAPGPLTLLHDNREQMDPAPC
jgi:hypothetical protein